MNFKKLVALVVAAGIGSASAATSLAGRDINRNGVAANTASLVYLRDQVLGITWLRDANVTGLRACSAQDMSAQTLSTGTGTGANVISDWRLLSMTDGGTAGCNFSHAGGTE